MNLLTEQGTPLTLHLAAIPRLPAGHSEPIVEFRYTGGILCSSYYLSTFLEVSSGLCLQGGTYSRQDIDANTVNLCKQQCVAWMQERGITLQQPKPPQSQPAHHLPKPTMPTTVELTDRLDDIIDSTWEDVVELLKEYFVANGGDFPCLHTDLDYRGAVEKLIDSAVPIYTSELNELAYFHHDAAIAALVDTFGSPDGDWPSGTFAAGLYQLIDNGINERWHEEAEDLWEEWTDLLDDKAVRQFALSAWSAQQAKQQSDQITEAK